MHSPLAKGLFTVSLVLIARFATAQATSPQTTSPHTAASSPAKSGGTIIHGTVYDGSQRTTLAGVSVMTTSGNGTATDSLGHYSIRLAPGDSLYFSYLGKFTARFPLLMIDPTQPFDMSLDLSPQAMPEVYVQSKNYLLDSLGTRREYQKIFDYSPDYLTNMRSNKGGRSLGVGLNLDLLLQPAKERRMEAFQARLLWQEHENYIDHHWTPSIVAKVTGLESPALDSFMKFYRPSYEFLQTFETDYTFYKYIKDCARFYNSLN